MNGIPTHCQWEYKMTQPLWRTVWKFLKMVNRPSNSTMSASNSIPRNLPKRNENIHLHKDVCVNVYRTIIHHRQTRTQPSGPSPSQCAKKRGAALERQAAQEHKANQTLIRATARINLKIIMPSIKKLEQKTTYYSLRSNT